MSQSAPASARCVATMPEGSTPAQGAGKAGRDVVPFGEQPSRATAGTAAAASALFRRGGIVVVQTFERPGSSDPEL